METKIQSFLTLVCQKLQAFDRSQILSVIPAEVLRKIKEKDEHPFFQAYSICHEGVSTPRLIGDTAKPISWTRRAIQSLKKIITKGVKFFAGHNEDNSTEGRQVLGEIIADTQQVIDGKLHHIVISYHSPDVREKVKNYDVCSQEANWNFIEAGNGLIANSIRKLTGIALSNSNVNKPAFSGAVRLGMVQAFDETDGEEPEPKIEPKGKTGKDIKMDLTTINFSDLIGEVKRRQTFPSQIYSLDEIKQDNKFLPVFTELESLKTKLTEKDTEIETIKNENKTLVMEGQKATAKERLNSIMQSVNVTELQKNWIEKSFEKGKIEDYTDDSLKSFVTSELDNFKDYAPLLSNGKDLDLEKNRTPSDTDDMTKAENNPLLEEDYNED